MKIKSSLFRNIFKLAIIIFLSLKASLIKAQIMDNDATIKMKNTFYIDFSTKGAYYSINYDRIFYQKKIYLSYRLGLSVLPDAIAFPVGINLFFGKKNSHAEISLSLTPYIDQYKSFLSKDDLSDKYIYIVPGFGYRYQKPKGGLFIKVAVSPMMFLDPPSDDFWKMNPKLYFATNMGVGLSF